MDKRKKYDTRSGKFEELCMVLQINSTKALAIIKAVDPADAIPELTKVKSLLRKGNGLAAEIDSFDPDLIDPDRIIGCKCACGRSRDSVLV